MEFTPLSVLAHVERRRILSELSKSDDPITVPDIYVSPIGTSVDTEILNDVLYYHLPKMAEHGYVNFDRDTRTVSKGYRFDTLRPYLLSSNGYRDVADSG